MKTVKIFPLFLLSWCLVGTPTFAGGKVALGGTAASNRPPTKMAADSGIEATGRIWPKQRFSVVMRPNLVIHQTLVQTGDMVKQGDRLLLLEDDSLLTLYSQLESQLIALRKEQDRASLLSVTTANLKNRLTQIKQDESELLRQGDGLSKSLLNETLRNLQRNMKKTTEEFLLADTELTLVRQRINEQEDIRERLSRRLTGLKKQMMQLEVRAPFSGKVVQVSSISDHLRPGATILTLWGEGGYEVKGKVSQHQLDRIKPNSDVRIYTGYYNDRYVLGVVREILPLLTETEEKGFPNFTVLIDVPHSADIVPGSSVSLRILPPTKVSTR